MDVFEGISQLFVLGCFSILSNKAKVMRSNVMFCCSALPASI